MIPARLERATHSLEGCCSIQLSYGTKRTANIVKKRGLPNIKSGFLTQGETCVGDYAEHDDEDGVGFVAEGCVEDTRVPAC